MPRMPETQRLEEITRLEKTFWAMPGVVPAGMDEVGRGPLAGPVVAACVALPAQPLIAYVNDSKKLSPARREKVYDEILRQALGYGLGWVAPETIDEINILQATRQAMCKAVEAMTIRVTDLLVDAVKDLPLPQKQHAYVHGDSLSYLIGAASIVAKVQRDRYMVEQDAFYPQYGFARNKGYGTAEHIAALKAYGPCAIHRKTFIKNFL